MNRRFQAQTQARLGLDRLRREVHCAMSVTTANGGATAILTIPATCPTSGGLTSITWCSPRTETAGTSGATRGARAAAPAVSGPRP